MSNKEKVTYLILCGWQKYADAFYLPGVYGVHSIYSAYNTQLKIDGHLEKEENE